MTGLSWNSSLATGDIAVDEQHQQLFELYNSIHDTAIGCDWGSAIGEALVRLSRYTSCHFEAEYRLMVASGYPAAAMLDHVREHLELARRTEDIRTQFREGRIATIMPLTDLLREWMTCHIYKCDLRLVEYCQTMGQAL